MIKGILALFRSGLIFNPMVFLGILIGFIAMGMLEDDMLKAFYTNPGLYVLMLLIAVFYVYFFKCVYISGKSDIDWKETLLTMLGHFLMMIVSFISSMLFASMIISLFSPRITTNKTNVINTQIEQKTNSVQDFENIKNEIEQLQNEYNEIMKSYEISQ